jgi:hypothetical protein
MTSGSKSPHVYSLLEANLKELDGWGIQKRYESPRIMDCQCNLDKMQVYPSTKGWVSCPTSLALAMHDHEIETRHIEPSWILVGKMMALTLKWATLTMRMLANQFCQRRHYFYC